MFKKFEIVKNACALLYTAARFINQMFSQCTIVLD